MPQVQQTLTITIDDAVFEVANMSNDVQQLIAYMDEWRQKEADLTSDLLMVRAAIHDVQASLLQVIQGEQQQAAAQQAAAQEAEPAPKKGRGKKGDK